MLTVTLGGKQDSACWESGSDSHSDHWKHVKIQNNV